VTWDVLRAELETELRERVTVDALTAGWSIAQRAKGHRHSVDDVLTAHFALQAAPGAATVLDLGTGIGGVGLLVLWGLGPAATLVAIEAQPLSHRLLLANVAGNGLAARVEPHLGDLRHLADPRRFPLITGSPPYFPIDAGIVPADSQKAHARFELRGDIRDYARAAARHLTEDGVFVFCFPSTQRARAVAAAVEAGLAVTAIRDVIPRASLRPLFTLFACARRAGAAPHEGAPLVVRDEAGHLTDEMQAVRRRFGFAPGTSRKRSDGPETVDPGDATPATPRNDGVSRG
jgi:tRNA1(Val) A37 N6-methylase TrmN6